MIPALQIDTKSGNPRRDRSNVERMNRLIADGGASSRSETHDAILALTDSELESFGLNAYRMNLLSLFATAWPRSRIDAAARDAAISKLWLGWEYHHHYLPQLTSKPDAPQLKNLPAELIRDLLSRGRGLIMATFHHGHFRYIPSDLAHAGIPLCVPLASDAFNDYKTAREANPGAALWKSFSFVDVEQRSGSLALARTLARGGFVAAAFDGNTGVDGPRGSEVRGTVDILGCQARVKEGLIRLAARFGSPILPVFAWTADGERVCRTAQVIDPARPLQGEEMERFVKATAQEIYSHFGRNISSAPGEWSGGDLFHQWRVPGQAFSADSGAVEARLQEDLQAGARIIVNGARIVALSGSEDIVWTDAITLRCYRIPSQMAHLADQLAKASGVDANWLDRLEPDDRARTFSFLCQLAARGAISSAADGALR